METTTLNINDIKKELMKSKVMANFSHYVSGNLYYTVKAFDVVYQFPIATIEIEYIEPLNEGEDEREITVLSRDLGTTAFNAEVRGSELNRWIAKAFEKGEFVKVS